MTARSQTAPRPRTPRPLMKQEAFLGQVEDRFQVRLKDIISEVRSEDDEDRDWSRVERQFLAYGMFLEELA